MYSWIVSRWVPLLILVATLAPTSLVGQREGRRFGDELVVREVLLDVVVTDKKGRVIVGLDKDDFEVRERGDELELTGVSFYSSRELVEARAAVGGRETATPEVPRDRYFILFFQDRRLSGTVRGLTARQQAAGRAAREWVTSGMLPTDWVAVASYYRQLEVHQDFTHDREALATAVERASLGKSADGNWPSRRPAASGGPSLLAAMPAGNELRDATKSIYKGLRVLAAAAGEVPGRKVMLFFGVGFGGMSQIGFWEPDRPHFYDTIHDLNDNNVAVYTLDVTGSNVRHNLESSLADLATSTGGDYFRLYDNLEGPLAAISRANSGYYLLSYKSAQPAGKSGYQRVKVRMKNRELRVRARGGYLYSGEG